ncbi:hypothetical protein HK104_006912, partial [Borealophlyctis nickersoniae]
MSPPTSTLTALHAHLDLIRRKATGELPTTARWIRDFVMGHEKYKGDSVVGPEVVDDPVPLTTTSSSVTVVTTDEPDEKQHAETKPTTTTTAAAAAAAASATAAGTLMQKEERETGSVKTHFLATYLHMSGGAPVVVLTLFLACFSQVARVLTDNWLTQWTSHTHDISQAAYQGIWVGLGVVQITAAALQALLAAISGLWAAERLHRKALESIFRAPLRFFDTTPLGRIINRFSTDIEQIDTTLPEYIRIFILYISMTLANFIYIAVIFPLFFAPLIPALLFFYWLQDFYRSTSRELKRIMSVTFSPVVAQVSETLSGLATIRAYGAGERLEERLVEVVGVWDRPYYLGVMIQRWLSTRLELVSSILIFFTGIFVMHFRDTIPPSIAGLSIAYALQVTAMFNVCVKVLCDTEMTLNSAERLIHYSHGLECEGPTVVEGQRPPKGWPQTGKVEVRG